MKIAKEILLTIAYLIVLSIILGLNNIAFGWLTTKAIIPLFEWFYKLDLFWKIIVLFFGGISIISILYNLLSFLGVMINLFFSNVFPSNKVTLIGSIILCVLNIIYLELFAWRLPKHDFWLFGLWLIIATIIIQLNWIFVYKSELNE